MSTSSQRARRPCKDVLGAPGRRSVQALEEAWCRVTPRLLFGTQGCVGRILCRLRAHLWGLSLQKMRHRMRPRGRVVVHFFLGLLRPCCSLRHLPTQQNRLRALQACTTGYEPFEREKERETTRYATYEPKSPRLGWTCYLRHDSNNYFTHNCAAVPKRARIKGS
jgi:hypothetical protein